jgi:nucleotide-binding universal stress UspA family protein
MNRIVCATRGGEGSRAAQIAAIQRAKAESKRLTFLFVTDPASLGHVDDLLLTAVQEELNWMGQTLLSIARRRAHLAGLEAEVVVRVGEVAIEIVDYLKEYEPDLLLLGAPRGTTANVFGDDAIERFSEAVEKETNVPVEIIRPEHIR